MIKIVKDKVWKYLHQAVVVRAFGIEYTGIFKGADEEWMFLQCETTWVQIPWLAVSSFKPAEAKEEARIYRAIEGESEPTAQAKRNKRARDFERELRIIRGGKDADERSELSDKDELGESETKD